MVKIFKKTIEREICGENKCDNVGNERVQGNLNFDKVVYLAGME